MTGARTLRLRVDGNRLDAKFLRETGAIADSFTIIKGEVTATPTPTAVLPTATRTPTRTATSVPPTATPTRTPTSVPPTMTPTRTATPIPSGVPSPPSSLTATGVSRNRIDLAWTDNSGNETGFQIERSRDAASWSLLASPPANSVSYSDTAGLTPNKVFYYRVRAVNAGGPSAWSNTASARTPKK